MGIIKEKVKSLPASAFGRQVWRGKRKKFVCMYEAIKSKIRLASRRRKGKMKNNIVFRKRKSNSEN